VGANRKKNSERDEGLYRSRLFGQSGRPGRGKEKGPARVDRFWKSKREEGGGREESFGRRQGIRINFLTKILLVGREEGRSGRRGVPLLYVQKRSRQILKR